ncbi:alpha amylase C-terminal domain-containing protein [Alteromonas sp. McT4-15]|uniref:alpha-amylase family glycosyl hydrolase n=1 Tax=Alteromonas sp. McT4-15 TaxID=2881256 RepID=UPI001CF83222|nr:alpha-amylase family glycosyl hydrolase [Alteromonas sp. McT4-15]MCB4436817.1 alpha amylase C-terminal domain-containing protein [Alteromonas sp. McT4-15]
MQAQSIEPQNLYSIKQPSWSSHSVIYQVNTRQFSASGSFSGVTEQLERIKALGADILWLMPIHPIGEKNKKGKLGSPYAVKDYLAINPEFGNEEDFRTLIKKAHELSLKVIIDWVPNHSAWDNPLVESNPQWYAKDYKGDFRPSPWWDWSDIIEFDYSQVGLREYMIAAMKYWVETFDIDGFRCDVAGYVPNDFWQQARTALDSVKPVFMLAEWENRDLHEKAFNMTYAWSWNETLHELAHGKCSLDRLRKYYSWNERSWPLNAYRMTFVSNHDKNAWDGTQREQFGDALEACIALSVIGEGMPLIHNGQEAGETKRLAFFERDPIEWQEHAIGTLYRKLISLKQSKTVLGNGEYGARMIQIPNSDMDRVFSFVRHNESEKVFVVINFSSDHVEVAFEEPLFEGKYTHWVSNESRMFSAGSVSKIAPWQFEIWVR